MVPVLCEPLAALLPDQLPLAVQLVGLFVTLQVIVDDEPVVIDVGLTDMLTTGVAITVTVAEAVPEPAELLQLNV